MCIKIQPTDEAKKKVIGILGGMGPYATVDFFNLLLRCENVDKDCHRARIIIDSNVEIPSRTRALLYGEASPVRGMVESINSLEAIGAEIVAVPCNSAHYFYNDVVKQISIPWINIIEATASKVIDLGKEFPLILGGYAINYGKLYTKYLPKSVYLSSDENLLIQNFIEEIKATSTLSNTSVGQFMKLINKKRNIIDSVILGCTEFPLVFKDKKLLGFPVINSSLEYAKVVVQIAHGIKLF